MQPNGKSDYDTNCFLDRNYSSLATSKFLVIGEPRQNEANGSFEDYYSLGSNKYKMRMPGLFPKLPSSWTRPSTNQSSVYTKFVNKIATPFPEAPIQNKNLYPKNFSRNRKYGSIDELSCYSQTYQNNKEANVKTMQMKQYQSIQ